MGYTRPVPNLEARIRTEQEVHNALVSLETRHDLLRHQVDGWRVWPLLRFSVGMALQGLQFRWASGGWSSIGMTSVLKHAATDLWAVSRPPRARLAAAVYDSDLTSDPVNGRIKDIFFDDLLEAEGDWFKLEHLTNRHYAGARRRALHRSQATTTLPKLLSLLLARMGGIPEAGPCAESIAAALQVTGFDAATLSREFRKFAWRKRIYRSLLRRVQPRTLLVLAAFGEHALVAAARELGIRVVELQHGTLGRYHFGYSWTSDALPHKSSMPLPDRIFLYGDYWKRELEAGSFWNDELRSVGSLRMDGFASGVRPKGSDLTLVVTTQGMESDRLIAFLKETLRLAADRDPLRLRIRLHPNEGPRTRDEVEAALGRRPDVEVLLPTDPPSTFELIAGADVHASIASTCHYEALGLGVPTIILPFANYETVLRLRESGHAFLARTPEELLHLVRELKGRPVPAGVRSTYFQPGALDAMRRELAT